MKGTLCAAALVAVVGAPVAAIAAAGQSGSAVPSAEAVGDIPADLLVLYQRSAERCPGLPWAVLAAIGKIESNHGRSTLPGVRSGSNEAGAAGPMQFGIGGRAGDTWSQYGVDGNGDGIANVYDAADAVPAAADYLCANGGGTPGGLSKAIFAYNRADWYVADVLAQAAAYSALQTVPSADSTVAQKAIAFAESKLGLPYQWGGTGPLYDCSGLTQAAYAAAGVQLSRTSREQYWNGPKVALAHLQPGDLVFYADDVTDPSTIGHLGLYVGGGRMIEAARTGTVIRYASIDRPGFIGAVRPVGVAAVGSR
jgi:cell wall-associated NlpC family hydrolase